MPFHPTAARFSGFVARWQREAGKTVVMAMLIAWQVLNKVAYPQDDRYSKHIFIVAPGLTVKSRLQVLIPAGPGNYYDEFDIVPGGLHDQLRQGESFGSQLARFELGDGRQIEKAAQRGQARREKRRGLRP